MNQVTVDANTLISVLKAQRNAALDDVAMMQARTVALEKENAELLNKIQQAQLAEANKER